MCKLISYMVPEGPPYYASGATKAVTKCEEHGWMIDGGIIGPLCPLGMIEKAVEGGLAKIAAAVTNGVRNS
jgi:hypothetical protein